MKKLFIISVLFCTISFAFGQNKKGNWLVGTYVGGAGLGFGESEGSSSAGPGISKSESNSFNIGIGPNAGYYVSDNLVIGTYLGISFYHSKNDGSNTISTSTSESKYSSTYVSVGPFGRFYFGNNKSKGMPYAQINGGINFYPSYSGEYTPSTGISYKYDFDKYSSWSAGAQLGYEHFINQVIGLQYYIGYGYSYYKSTTMYDYSSGTDYSYSSKSTSHGINFGAGLQIHLECTKKKK